MRCGGRRRFSADLRMEDVESRYPSGGPMEISASPPTDRPTDLSRDLAMGAAARYLQVPGRAGPPGAG